MAERRPAKRFRPTPRLLEDGRLAADVAAKASFEKFYGVVHVEAPGANKGEATDFDVDTVVLTMQLGFSYEAPFRLNLTSLTEGELLAFKQLVDVAVQLAHPTVQTLDRETLASFEGGGDVYSRLYRPAASIYIRDASRPVLEQGSENPEPLAVDGSEDN